MTTFLDVGAHCGQTLRHVLAYPRVTRAYAFEPSLRMMARLAHVFGGNPRVTLCPYGLWNKTCTTTLHDDGSQGASVWADYRPSHPSHTDVVCDFRRASDWIRENVEPGARVILKLNCEGCEADILDDLLDTGMYDRLTYVLVDWDVRKSPSQANRQAEVEARLAGKTNWAEYHGPERLALLRRLLKQPVQPDMR